MVATRAYLDHNASAPLRESARVAMIEALSASNASSVHAEGRVARKIVEEARRNVASLVNADPAHVIFTSGATESASTLLVSEWRMGRGPVRMSHLYVCEADHPCLLGGGRFDSSAVTRLPVDSDGVLDLAFLKSALDAHDKEAGLPLVAVHLANNETGVIQPVERITEIVHAAGGVVILDAVQAVGRIPVDIAAGYADYMILSSHKIGGPKGVGAIVAASDLMMPKPLIAGGGQEKGHRAGTENVPGIAGFGAAAREALAELPLIDSVRERRDSLEEHLLASDSGVEIFGARAQRLPNTTFFALAGMKAETSQIAFDLAGVAISAGSACSSGKVGPSHVLKAMGFGDRAGALRVSMGMATTDDDIDLFRRAWAGILARRPKVMDGATKAA
ncbi:MAG: cysteine desulfurase [Rhizobiaceae bacterium]|nr:cysteine desulfurase [Rhizobiaceae bacterium]